VDILSGVGYARYLSVQYTPYSTLSIDYELYSDTNEQFLGKVYVDWGGRVSAKVDKRGYVEPKF